jgi:hypothetical protein
MLLITQNVPTAKLIVFLPTKNVSAGAWTFFTAQFFFVVHSEGNMLPTIRYYHLQIIPVGILMQLPA